jgi:Family of unknown function (DUF6194)
MTIDELTGFIESLAGVLTLRPGPGDGSPEAAWGDLFFYFAPDRVVPSGQPFATIVTKDYPGEPSSGLGDGVYRINVDAGRRDQGPCEDPAARDTVIPHPVYGQLGWVSVVQPGPRTTSAVQALLRDAHAAAQRRWDRRHA